MKRTSQAALAAVVLGATAPAWAGPVAAALATTRPATAPAAHPTPAARQTVREIIIGPDGQPMVVETEVEAAPDAAGTGDAAKPAASPLVAAVKQLQFQRDPAALIAAVTTRPAAATTTASATAPADPAARAAAFQQDVIAGRWDRVATFLADLTPEEADQVFLHVATALAAPAPGAGAAQPQQMVYQDGEMVAMSPAAGGAAGGLLADEVLALAAAYPAAPTEAHVAALGNLLKLAATRAPANQATLDALDAGRGRFGGGDAEDRRRAADLLFAAGMDAQAGRFLPPLPGEDAEDEVPADAESAAAARAILLNDHARVDVAEAAALAAADAAAAGKSAADLNELRALYRNYGWPVPANLDGPADAARKFYAGYGDALRLSGRVLRLDGAAEPARTAAVARAAEMLTKVPDPQAVRVRREAWCGATRRRRPSSRRASPPRRPSRSPAATPARRRRRSPTRSGWPTPCWPTPGDDGGLGVAVDGRWRCG